MKFSLSWLKVHLETKADAAALGERMTSLGLEVEALSNPAEALADFIVAEVVETRPHPDADRLTLCKVSTGGATHEVVCGALNVRAGMRAVFAAPGMRMPASGDVLKPAKIRGVQSNGMLCSEREMGLSEAHEGIIALPDTAEVGKPFAPVLGLDDAVFDIALTPNRGDCFGVRGIARDLAASGIGSLKPAPAPKIKSAFDMPVEIRVDWADACPVFAGCVVRGVQNRQSPAWLARRLEAAGLRPINALVDITNYIALDLARPLHVYDLAKLEGAVCARAARKGERLDALDGKTHDLTPDMCVIADDARVLGLGGVMGGRASGASEATRDVLIESAWFDPVRTAQTGRALNIESDARMRFERGVDPASVADGLAFATQMILDLCGGEASKPITAGRAPTATREIIFAPSEVARLTGLDVPADESRKHLEALGFTTKSEGKNLRVSAPSWRRDIDGAADLVEEIVRLRGVDSVRACALPPRGALARVRPNITRRRATLARALLAARGAMEAITWSFVSGTDAQHFAGAQKPLRLVNPISSDMSDMRPSLLPGLLAAARRNLHRGATGGALFEIGPVFTDAQKTALALVRFGARHAERHFRLHDAPVSYMDIKDDLMALLAGLGFAMQEAPILREAPDWYHPGRSGVLRLGRGLVSFGELHPLPLKAMDCPAGICAFELVLDTLPPPKQKRAGAFTPPKLASVRRDFAFLVDADSDAGALLRAVRGADKKHIVHVVLFDVFTGKGVPAGKKSLAVEVVFQPAHASFTDAALEAMAQKIAEAVQKSVGGVLRTE